MKPNIFADMTRLNEAMPHRQRVDKPMLQSIYILTYGHKYEGNMYRYTHVHVTSLDLLHYISLTPL